MNKGLRWKETIAGVEAPNLMVVETQLPAGRNQTFATAADIVQCLKANPEALTPEQWAEVLRDYPEVKRYCIAQTFLGSEGYWVSCEARASRAEQALATVTAERDEARVERDAAVDRLVGARVARESAIEDAEALRARLAESTEWGSRACEVLGYVLGTLNLCDEQHWAFDPLNVEPVKDKAVAVRLLVRDLRARLAKTEQVSEERRDYARAQNAKLSVECDDLRAQLTAVERERDAARSERDTLGRRVEDAQAALNECGAGFTGQPEATRIRDLRAQLAKTERVVEAARARLTDGLKSAAGLDHSGPGSASFSRIFPEDTYPTNEKEADAFVKARMRLWFTTWIVTPMQDALRALDNSGGSGAATPGGHTSAVTDASPGQVVGAAPRGPDSEPEPAGSSPPRRDRLDMFTPAERAIWDATQAVERAGCDVRLTAAVNALHEARSLVADFVDGVKREPAPYGHISKADECQIDSPVVVAATACDHKRQRCENDHAVCRDCGAVNRAVTGVADWGPPETDRTDGSTGAVALCGEWLPAANSTCALPRGHDGVHDPWAPGVKSPTLREIHATTRREVEALRQAMITRAELVAAVRAAQAKCEAGSAFGGTTHRALGALAEALEIQRT